MLFSAMWTKSRTVLGYRSYISEMKLCLVNSVVQKLALFGGIAVARRVLKMLYSRGEKWQREFFTSTLSDLGVAQLALIRSAVVFYGISAKGTVCSRGVRVYHSAENDLLDAVKGIYIKSAQIENVLFAENVRRAEEIFVSFNFFA